jgi:hypothetical protein
MAMELAMLTLRDGFIVLCCAGCGSIDRGHKTDEGGLRMRSGQLADMGGWAVGVACSIKSIKR